MVRICSAHPVRLTSDFHAELASYSNGKEVLIHSPEGSTRRQRFHSALRRSESETEENFCAFWAIKRLCRRKITGTSGLWLKHSWDRGSWVNGSTIFQPGRIGSVELRFSILHPSRWIRFHGLWDCAHLSQYRTQILVIYFISCKCFVIWNLRRCCTWTVTRS